MWVVSIALLCIQSEYYRSLCIYQLCLDKDGKNIFLQWWAAREMNSGADVCYKVMYSLQRNCRGAFNNQTKQGIWPAGKNEPDLTRTCFALSLKVFLWMHFQMNYFWQSLPVCPSRICWKFLWFARDGIGFRKYCFSSFSTKENLCFHRPLNGLVLILFIHT